MFDKNLIARSHFTRKADGMSAFEQFKKEIGVHTEDLPFEYEEESPMRHVLEKFVAESWGGYEDRDGRWVVFISWRCARANVTTWIRWQWDEVAKVAGNRDQFSWRN